MIVKNAGVVLKEKEEVVVSYEKLKLAVKSLGNKPKEDLYNEVADELDKLVVLLKLQKEKLGRFNFKGEKPSFKKLKFARA